MAGTVSRSPFQGVWTVLRFNWHLHALAMALVAVLLASAFYLPAPARPLAFLAAAAALLQLPVSLAATWLAYDASGLYELSWLAPLLADARRGANLHAGFDETTQALRATFPSIHLQVFDFYDPAKHTEISIRRARKAHPPAPDTVPIRTDTLPLPDACLDVALLFLAAHEIRDAAERARFFQELRRVLGPGGRVILTEHLRDLPNILAYSIGAWHFHSRSEWLATFDAAGFHVAGEVRNNPFITTFILCAHENPA